MAPADTCYKREAGGILLAVRLTPRAQRDAIDGVGVLSDGRIVAQVRVRALPSEGEANTALVALIAKSLRLPKSAVTIAAGHSARLKQVRVTGDPDTLAGEVDGWASSGARSG